MSFGMIIERNFSMPVGDIIAPLMSLMSLSHLFDAVMHFGVFLVYASGAFIKYTHQCPGSTDLESVSKKVT